MSCQDALTIIPLLTPSLETCTDCLRQMQAGHSKPGPLPHYALFQLYLFLWHLCLGLVAPCLQGSSQFIALDGVRIHLGDSGTQGSPLRDCKEQPLELRELAQKFLRPPWVVMQNIYVCTASSYPLGEKHEWTWKQGNIPDITLLSSCAHCMTLCRALSNEWLSIIWLSVNKKEVNMHVSLRKEMMKLGQNTWKGLHFKTPFSFPGQSRCC